MRVCVFEVSETTECQRVSGVTSVPDSFVFLRLSSGPNRNHSQSALDLPPIVPAYTVVTPRGVSFCVLAHTTHDYIHFDLSAHR